MRILTVYRERQRERKKTRMGSGTVSPEVVGSIPAKTQKTRTQIYMDLRHIDPQARVLNYCFK